MQRHGGGPLTSSPGNLSPVNCFRLLFRHDDRWSHRRPGSRRRSEVDRSSSAMKASGHGHGGGPGGVGFEQEVAGEAGAGVLTRARPRLRVSSFFTFTKYMHWQQCATPELCHTALPCLPLSRSPIPSSFALFIDLVRYPVTPASATESPSLYRYQILTGRRGLPQRWCQLPICPCSFRPPCVEWRKAKRRARVQLFVANASGRAGWGNETC
jgi:hypothetical protein